MTFAPDLFGHTPPPPMRVQLDRTIDRTKPCCGNTAIIGTGARGRA
jgi:hypothetical protein